MTNQKHITLTLTNDFHNSEVSVRVFPGYPLSDAQVRKIRKALCGVDGCCCGDELGMRGSQDGLKEARIELQGHFDRSATHRIIPQHDVCTG